MPAGPGDRAVAAVSPVRDSARIAAAPDVVFAVLLDVEAYPSWQREVSAVEVLDRDPQGRPLTARTRIAALGRAGSYTLRYRYPDATTMTYSLVEADMMSRHDGTLRVVERDGGSELSVELDIALKWPVPGVVVGTFTRRGVVSMLRAVRERAESRG